MDSQNNTHRQTTMKRQDILGYGTVVGVLCIDLLMLVGNLRVELLLPALLISMIVIYRTMTQKAKQSGLTRPSAPKSVDDSTHCTEESESAPEPNAVAPQPRDSKTASLSSIHLLILSGNKRTQQEVAKYVQGWGARFTQVESSIRAFATLIEASDAGTPFQAVLVDQSSLDMEESQFAIALRAEPSLQALYLIHYGNSTLPSRIEQLYMAGYSGMLSTPLDKTLLFKTLHNACETSAHHHDVVQLLDHYESEKLLQPLDILIACTSANESRKIHRILTNSGHQAFVVDDAPQLLDALDNHHFDLAILDAELPDISGIEAVKLYRFAHLSQPWIPFILLLDSPSSQTIQSCEAAEIKHLLAKPISPPRLMEAVARAMDLGDENHNNGVFDYPTAQGSTEYHGDSLILDTHQLNGLTRLGKRKGFLLELIKQFEKESRELLHSLQFAAAGQDIPAIQECGHKLKDTAGNLGAMTLYRMAVRLSRIESLDLKAEVDELVSDIDNCRTATIQALHEHLAMGNSSAYEQE